MELDSKHTVLFAVYSEYQKDIPDMGSITPDLLKMERRVFNIACMKLENEGFISGLKTFPPHADIEPRAVSVDGVKPTRYGIEYVEQKLELDRMGTGREKLRQLKEKFSSFSWNVLQDVVVEILSKMF